MLIEAILLPLIIGKIKGGKINNLLNIHIPLWWLFIIGGGIEFFASFLRAKEIGIIWQIIDNNIIWIHIVIYLLLIVGLAYNYKEKGFIIILIGILLNFIVITANQGRMPVDITNIQHLMSKEKLEYLINGKDLVHIPLDNATKLRFLADIIHLKKPYPFQKSISIGDVFIIIGIFKFIYNKMLQKE